MMRGYHAALEEWRPVLKNMSKFSELFHPKTRDYIEWFIEAGGGLSQEIATADEQQLKNWHKIFMDVETVKDKVSKATEVSFFREDFKPTLQFCQDCLTLLEQYNVYKSQVLKASAGDEFQPMQQKLEALIKFLSSFPTSGEVDMCEGFNAGALKVGNFQWVYEHMPKVAQGHVEFRAKAQPEMHPFYTVGGFEIVSSDHGTVLWNKSSWVWFHPQVPFTLRFNYKRADSLFAWHGVKGDCKKAQHAVLPSWKWNGKNGLQPVLAASATLDPAIKSQFASVVVTDGDVPLPVMLLAAMTQHIRYITFTLLGYE